MELVPARLSRVLAVVIVVWIAVGLFALVLYHWDGTHPVDRGKGEPVRLSRTASRDLRRSTPLTERSLVPSGRAGRRHGNGLRDD